MPPSPRLSWPDVARGVSVTLVVMLHTWLLHTQFWLEETPGYSEYGEFVSAMTPIRIPLFFLVSGYLASRSVWRPWRDAARGRVWSILYLYVLWLVIFAGFLALDAAAGGFEPGNLLKSILLGLVLPETHLWYLWALVAFFLVARATRALPAWLAIGIAVLLALVVAPIVPETWAQMIRGLGFYLIGARATAIVERAVARPAWLRALVLTAAFATGMALARITEYESSVTRFLLSAVGVGAALSLIAPVASSPVLRPIRAVGRRTLPVFVLHPILLVLMNDLLRASPDFVVALRLSPVSWAYPIVLAVLVIAVCIGVDALARRIGAGWLFALPPSWTWPRARLSRLGEWWMSRTDRGPRP